MTYTLYYTTTTADATGVTITEIIPDHTTANAQNSANGWVCPDLTAGSVCTLALADSAVTAGSSGSIPFIVTVVAAPIPSRVETIINTATINPTASDPTPDNNHATLPLFLAAVPDLAITKNDGGVIPQPGETVVYTLTVVNNGAQAASGVELTETVPPHTTASPQNITNGWVCPDGNEAGKICTFPLSSDLAPNMPLQVPFLVQVNDAVPFAVTEIENTASVADDNQGGADPTDDNSVTIFTPVDVLPVLTLTQTDGDVDVIAGDVLTYTLTVTNSGAQATHQLIITETVPAYTQFVGPPGLWHCFPDHNAGAQCVHTIDTLAVDQSIAVAFVVQVLDPLADGVTELENRALLCGSDLPESSVIENTPVTTPPDLTLNKQTQQSVVTPGDLLLYELAYSNQGGRPAINTLITEMIPAHTTFRADESAPGWNCPFNPSAQATCTFAVGAVAASASDKVLFAVQVNTPLANGVTQLENAAEISHDGSQGTEPTPLDNKSSSSVSVDAAPDLKLTKNNDAGTATAGQTVIYDLLYENVGNQSAINVLLYETVPAHSTFDPTESDPAWSCANNGEAGAQCTLPVGTLDGGEQGTASFAVNIDNLLPAILTPLVNRAEIYDDGSNGEDLTPSDNVAEERTPLKAAPALRVKIDDQGGQSTAGAQITYQITYSNTGVQAAQGVVISSTVPAYTVFVGPTDRWDCPAQAPAGTLCTTTIGLLAAQSQGGLNFIVEVNDPLPAAVDEARALAQIGNSAEPYAYEDRAATPINAAPELGLHKSDGGATVEPGQTVVYVLTYENGGNQAATGVLLHEKIPANTTFVAELSTPGWTCTEEQCTYTIGELGGGEQGEVVFAVQIDTFLRAIVTEVTNQAQISDDQHNGADLNPTNNSATDTTEIGLALGLLATMRAQLIGDADQNQTVSPGDTLAYLVEIRNQGNRPLTGVIFTDTLDPYTKLAGANTVQTSQGSVQAGNAAQDQTIAVNIGNIRAGDMATVTFRVVINHPLPATATFIEQQGTVTSNEVPAVSTDDPSIGGANDRTRTPVALTPRLRITKSDFHFDDADNNDKVSSGDKILYSIKVTNIGNAGTTNVTLTDTPDANSTLVVGRVQSSRGAILSGNRSGDTRVIVEIGALAAGESADINLLVTIKNALTSSHLTNQATVTYTQMEQLATAVSDDPATAQTLDATLTPINRTIADVLLQLYLPLVRKSQ